MKKLISTLASCAALLPTSVLATEGGGSMYPLGIENYTCCALPPPGQYSLWMGQHYSADELRDGNGDKLDVPGFKVTANAIVPRFVWVTDKKIAGASFGLNVLLPIVDLEVENAPTPAGLKSQSKTGIGDITFGPVLGWHHSEKLHTVLALDIYAPTGDYDVNDVANIGRNHWAVQPVYGLSYIQPSGLNAGVKFMYTYNMENTDTDYTDGEEITIDFAAGWALGNGLTVGLGGYYYNQISDDEPANADAMNFGLGKALALGPSLRYMSAKGWFVSAKYQNEFNVENRAAGSAFMFKAVFPL